MQKNNRSGKLSWQWQHAVTPGSEVLCQVLAVLAVQAMASLSTGGSRAVTKKIMWHDFALFFAGIPLLVFHLI